MNRRSVIRLLAALVPIQFLNWAGMKPRSTVEKVAVCDEIKITMAMRSIKFSKPIEDISVIVTYVDGTATRMTTHPFRKISMHINGFTLGQPTFVKVTAPKA